MTVLTTGAAHAPTLQETLAAQIASVRARVEGAGGAYAQEVSEIERAARAVPLVLQDLDLQFVDSLTPETGKPQFLLRAQDRSGNPFVLKVYGRARDREGRLQEAWTQRNRPVVPTIAHGNKALEGEQAQASWILMRLLPGVDLSHELANGDKQRLLARTEQLAHSMQLLADGTPTIFPDNLSLHRGIGPHLATVVPFLNEHGYGSAVPANWKTHARTIYNSGTASVLHGDLFGGNIRVVTGTPLQQQLGGADLVVYDVAGYVGAKEFDAARWIVRSAYPIGEEPGGKALIEQLRSAWVRGVESAGGNIDHDVLDKMIAIEALMQAGVLEIVKAEQGLPWQERDQSTLDLLDVAAERGLVIEAQNLGKEI